MNADHEYLAAGYVLGGLDAGEYAEAENLLVTSSEFGAEVAAVEETMGLLAASDEPVTPSAATEAAILSIPGRAEHSGTSAADERPAEDIPVSESLDEADLPGAISAPSAPTHADKAVSSPEAQTSPRRRSTMYLALAASGLLVLAAVLGGVAVTEYQQRADLEEQLVAEQERSSREDALLDAPDLSSTRVESEAGGGATVSYSLQEQMIRIAPEDMENPGDDQDLQMWIIDDDGAHPAGIMSATGASLVTDSSFHDGASFGITVEPAGGSDQPTSDPIVLAEL